MVARGRKTKPPQLKVVEGNPGKRKKTASKRRPSPREPVPRPPSNLNTAGKAEWRRVANALHALGMLTKLDRGLLTAYCDSWSMYVEARKHINRSGYTEVTDNGNLIQSPWVGIANRAKVDFTRYAAQLGLDPTARARLGIGEGEQGEDPAEKYL